MKRAPVVRFGLAAALGAWVVATALAQHPLRSFDRLRQSDPTGLVLPDWRFFGPDPARYDLVATYRGPGDGRWRRVTGFVTRRPLHAIWFPAARRQRAYSDMCRELVLMVGLPAEGITGSLPFQMILHTIRADIARRGEQLEGTVQIGIVAERPYDSATSPALAFLAQPVALDSVRRPAK